MSSMMDPDPSYGKVFTPLVRNDVAITKLTGGRVNYYLCHVAHPQREEQPAYQAECEDIIQALGMTFDEGCLFKALWRSAAARQANGKPGHSAPYDAEKMVHYAGRILRRLKWESSDEPTTLPDGHGNNC